MMRIIFWGVINVFLSCFSQVAAQTAHNITLLYHWQDTTLTDFTAHQSIYNEIFGFVQNGKEYGVIGSTVGAHIFDVTDGQNIHPVITIPAASQGSSVVNRDYDYFQNHLFMVGDQPGARFQIADVSFLPDSAPIVYDSDVLFERAHTITVDAASARLYANGGTHEMNIYDISNPAQPSLLLNCSDLPVWSAIQYVHDCFAKNDTVYCHAAQRGLFVMDFSDIQNPVLRGSVTQYPYQGYNHSGWLHKDRRLYAQADETHGYKLKIFDVSDLGDIKLVDTLTSGISPFSIPHNPVFRDNFLYVSYYHDGLYIFNFSDPENIYISGFYDTCELPDTANFRGCWGVYPLLPSGKVLASDMQNGFYVFDVTQAVSTKEATATENSCVIFPNPFSENFLVSVPGAKGKQYSYQLCDVHGKILKEGNITQSFTNIDASEFESGNYFLRVSGNGIVFTKKTVKRN